MFWDRLSYSRVERIVSRQRNNLGASGRSGGAQEGQKIKMTFWRGGESGGSGVTFFTHPKGESHLGSETVKLVTA